MVRTIDINKYLPVGVSLAGTGRHEINVTLTVEQLKERVYTVEVNDASFTGENDDYIYRAEPDTVNIRIEALAEELDSLTLDSSDIQVDVSSMGEGIHEAKVGLKLDLDRVYTVSYTHLGGSILTHDHFQGGCYEFAMAKAPVEKELEFKGFEDVKAGIVKWPMSVIRLNGTDSGRIVDLADKILKAWRGYTDEAAFIFAETDGEPHNTITRSEERRVGKEC